MRRPTRNEYGVQLDRNGYAPSIMPIDGFKCYICKQWKPTERHAMAHYHWTVSDFRRRFYKNYLDITED